MAGLPLHKCWHCAATSPHRQANYRYLQSIKRHLGAIALGAALLAAQPAFAKWQYTNWQMMPEDVESASGGKAALLEQPVETQSGLIVYAVGAYETGPFSFRVSFLFQQTDRVLERVVLRLMNNEAASQLYQNLVAEYNQPAKESIKSIQEGESHTAQWEDPQNNNLIMYYGIGDIYGVEYAPLSRSGNGF